MINNETIKEKRKLIIDILDDYEGSNISESDILEFKTKVKEIEKKIKESNKPKTITIPAKDHNIIKKYCALYGLNIGDFVSKLVLKEIENKSCLIIDENITNEDIKEIEVNKIYENYTNSISRRKYLIKTNKIILNSSFKFEGYSMIDSKPIYEFVGDMAYFRILHNLDSMGLELEVVNKREISLNIFSNMDLDVKTF